MINLSWKDIVKAKKLTPKQKKLDRNHNGVIDAQDFHIMGGSDEKMEKSPTRKHYTKDGKEWTGKTHKTKGKLMTGETHTDESVNLFHKDELPKSSARSAFTR